VRRPIDSDCWAVDVRNLAQDQHRERHQRAGITTRDDDSRLAGFHRLDRIPHGCAASPPCGGRRLFVHWDDFFDMPDLAPAIQMFSPAFEKRRNLRLVTMEQKRDFGVLSGRFCQPADHSRHPAIATHHIDRDRYLASMIRCDRGHEMRLMPRLRPGLPLRPL